MVFIDLGREPKWYFFFYAKWYIRAVTMEYERFDQLKFQVACGELEFSCLQFLADMELPENGFIIIFDYIKAVEYVQLHPRSIRDRIYAKFFIDNVVNEIMCIISSVVCKPEVVQDIFNNMHEIRCLEPLLPTYQKRLQILIKAHRRYEQQKHVNMSEATNRLNYMQWKVRLWNEMSHASTLSIALILCPEPTKFINDFVIAHSYELRNRMQRRSEAGRMRVANRRLRKVVWTLHNVTPTLYITEESLVYTTLAHWRDCSPKGGPRQCIYCGEQMQMKCVLEHIQFAKVLHDFFDHRVKTIHDELPPNSILLDKVEDDE